MSTAGVAFDSNIVPNQLNFDIRDLCQRYLVALSAAFLWVG